MAFYLFFEKIFIINLFKIFVRTLFHTFSLIKLIVFIGLTKRYYNQYLVYYIFFHSDYYLIKIQYQFHQPCFLIAFVWFFVLILNARNAKSGHKFRINIPNGTYNWLLICASFYFLYIAFTAYLLNISGLKPFLMLSSVYPNLDPA